jgi:hypothetical protein
VRVLVTGSRDWQDRDRIADRLAQLPPNTIVIEGGARGADRMARDEAHKLGLHVATVDALWRVYGNGAGYERNAAMVALLEPHRALAFPLGRSYGTRNCIRQIREAGIPLEVYEG